ncbi:MAG: hypothetical protein U5L95_00920 [Candidatus Saccharibacteria bacterium]|nr:hypothetical protein [Candidatus Saccharibacteria bacterium]
MKTINSEIDRVRAQEIMGDIALNERVAGQLLMDRKVERNMADPRSCREIAVSMAMVDIGFAFDVIEKTGIGTV